MTGLAVAAPTGFAVSQIFLGSSASGQGTERVADAAQPGPTFDPDEQRAAEDEASLLYFTGQISAADYQQRLREIYPDAIVLPDAQGHTSSVAPGPPPDIAIERCKEFDPDDLGCQVVRARANGAIEPGLYTDEELRAALEAAR